MAIHTEHETKHIRAATELFRTKCLLSEGSFLFGAEQLLTTEKLTAPHQALTGAPDTSGRTFDDKFRDQLQNQSDEVKRLAAEVMAVRLLFPSDKPAMPAQIWPVCCEADFS